MAIRVEDFRKHHGLQADPFATTDAADPLDLSAFFFSLDWFERFCDNRSAILFGHRGHGKTSHFREVSRRLRERPALVIHIEDYDLLPSETPQPQLLDNYRNLICRMALYQLHEEMKRHPTFLGRLRENDAYTHFCALVLLYYPLLAQQYRVPQEANELVQIYQRSGLGNREWLVKIAELVSNAGFLEIFCLLDGIDEWSQHSDVISMYRVIKPLLFTPAMLRKSGITFKFFLPVQLKPLMEADQFSFSRIPEVTLEWSIDHLMEMLARRLTYYSRLSETSTRGTIESFQHLCNIDNNVDRRIAQAAQGSPRGLIELVRRIVELHCRRVDDAESLIEAATIDEVLASSVAGATHVGATTLERTVGTGSNVQQASDAIPLLFLRQEGDIVLVFVGEQQIDLSHQKYVRRCLEYLWQRRPGWVAMDNLLAYVYADDSPETAKSRASKRDSLVGLIKRLRASLEPSSAHNGGSNSRTYVDGSPGQGYRLHSYRDT